MKYYNIKENKRYSGRNTDFGSLTGVGLKFIEVAELLGGRLRDALNGRIVDIHNGSDEYIIVSEVEGGFEEYFIDKKIWEIKKYIKLNNAKEIILEKRFDRFSRQSNIYIPRVVHYIKPPDEKITLIYKRVKVNGRIDPRKFDIKIPLSAEEIILQK